MKSAINPFIFTEITTQQPTLLLKKIQITFFGLESDYCIGNIEELPKNMN